jgi:hypothetical protein
MNAPFRRNTVTPLAAWTDFTPVGPWADGTTVVRNLDGIGFTYSASLNALIVIPNESFSIKDANNFIVQNLPAPTNGGDAANKTYVDGHAGGGGLADAPSDSTLYGRMNATWTHAVPLAGGTMTGLLTLSADPTAPLGAVTKQYSDLKAPLASPTFTGVPAAPTPATVDNSTKISTTAFVKAQGYLVTNATITLSGDISGSGTTAISAILATVNSNVGTYQGITVNGKGLVTGAVNMSYAPLASPTFTGVPAAPTPATADNSTTLATTAFVKAQGYLITNQTITLSGDISGTGTGAITTTLPTVNSNVGTFQGITVNGKGLVTGAVNMSYALASSVPSPSGTTPIMDGTAAAGVAVAYSRGDHVHPTDTTRAPLASPTFTGTPAAPTPATADNSTTIPTTAFVKAQGYLIGNQTVTLSGDVTGSGATAITTAIAANAVTNAKMATAPAFTLKGNATGSVAAPQDFTIAGLTAKATPVAADSLLLSDSAASGALKQILWSSLPSGGGGITDAPSDSTYYGRFNGTWANVLPLTGSAVRYDITQSLTASQLVQARQNIYAAPFDALAYNGIQINGSMEVSQQWGTTATTGGYTIDGWVGAVSGTMVLSCAQVADAPSGYSNSFKISVTTAEASLGANDYAAIFQIMEGFRTSRLAFGKATAQPISIGFWTKIHRTGMYSGSIRNSPSNRSYPFSFTQNVADTWEYKTITIPGDVTGTWTGNTNAASFILTLSMACGTTYQATAGAWTGVGQSFAVTGTTNGVAATTDTFQITGVVVLPGIELPLAARAPFIMRPFDEELRICQRYYEVSVSGVSQFPAAGTGTMIYSWHETKRINPTAAFITGPSYSNANSAVINSANVDMYVLQFTTTAIGGYIFGMVVSGDARL